MNRLTEALQENNPYEKLANILNQIPNGFAILEDGSHLKVLEWIFEPDEAELACKLKLSGETIQKMSKRLKIPIYELLPKIDHVIENIEKELAAGFSKVVVVTRNKTAEKVAKNHVQKNVDPRVFERVSFKVIKDFI